MNDREMLEFLVSLPQSKLRQYLKATRQLVRISRGQISTVDALAIMRDADRHDPVFVRRVS